MDKTKDSMGDKWKEKLRQRLSSGHAMEYYEVVDFILSEKEMSYREGLQEERQFILNILDGIDIADKEMGNVGGTKAIRFALQSRFIPSNDEDIINPKSKEK